MARQNRLESQLSPSGRPTGLTKTVHDAIIKSVKAGNFVTSAGEAAGIPASTVSRWMNQGSQGIEPYHSLYEGVREAMALAEARVVSELVETDEWRAKAWWLERGPGRRRWGSSAETLATDAVVALLDRLRSPSGAGTTALPAEANVVDENPHDTGDE